MQKVMKHPRRNWKSSLYLQSSASVNCGSILEGIESATQNTMTLKIGSGSILEGIESSYIQHYPVFNTVAHWSILEGIERYAGQFLEIYFPAKHPRRNWKLGHNHPSFEGTAGWSILEGIESEVFLSIPLLVFFRKHPRRNWKRQPKTWKRRKWKWKKHPRRNWNFLSTVGII